jgi:hypothetical protein
MLTFAVSMENDYMSTASVEHSTHWHGTWHVHTKVEHGTNAVEHETRLADDIVTKIAQIYVAS